MELQNNEVVGSIPARGDFFLFLVFPAWGTTNPTAK